MRKIFIEIIIMLFAIFNSIGIGLIANKEEEQTQVQTTSIQTETQLTTEVETTNIETTEIESTIQTTEETTTVAPTIVETKPVTIVETIKPTVAETQVQTVQETIAQMYDYTYKDGNGNTLVYHTIDEAKANIPHTNISFDIIKYDDFENQLLTLINQYRLYSGLNELVINQAYEHCAYYRATESAVNNWNVVAYENGAKHHIRPNFERASSIMADNGLQFTNYSEDYARFFQDAQSVLDGWKNSATHNQVLLTSWATQCGIGIAKDSQGYYYWIFIVAK